MCRNVSMMGKNSVHYSEGVYFAGSGSVVGKKEGEGPLGDLFDLVYEDDRLGKSSWEEAESTLQKEALEIALTKGGVTKEQIRYLFAGDLLGQSIATSFGLSSYNIPLFGLYGACSTCGESLLLASMLIAGGMAQYNACVTSSHFASAEKEFRYPLAYGNQRPLSATWTVTGSGAFVLSSEKTAGSLGKITGGTTGRIVDFGCKDSMNMGACMAPAAAQTLCDHFRDFQTSPGEYDRIITGDLGMVGRDILWDLMEKRGYAIREQYMDCGITIFDGEKQDTHSGGSGCGCAATVLSAYILKEIKEKHWNKVLFMPTGALLSKTSFNEGKTIPAIAHAIVIESL